MANLQAEAKLAETPRPEPVAAAGGRFEITQETVPSGLGLIPKRVLKFFHLEK